MISYWTNTFRAFQREKGINFLSLTKKVRKVFIDTFKRSLTYDEQHGYLWTSTGAIYDRWPEDYHELLEFFRKHKLLETTDVCIAKAVTVDVEQMAYIVHRVPNGGFVNVNKDTVAIYGLMVSNLPTLVMFKVGHSKFCDAFEGVNFNRGPEL